MGEDRQRMVNGFQVSSGPGIFLISLKAGGCGLHLTAADAVVMLDLDFNPQNMRQAEDRVHRLGQTRDVTVYYLVCRGSFEEMVLQRLFHKMKLDKFFGGEAVALERAYHEAQEREATSTDVIGGSREVGHGSQTQPFEWEVLDRLLSKCCGSDTV